ncbi:IS3 family transposase [Lactobacillaceae bacterium Melli_B4]
MKRYSEDFKDSLVSIYNSEHRSISSIAREYGVTVSTVSKWINDRKVVETDDGPVTVQDFKKLQKELAQVKRERDILKEAAIILGKPLSQKEILKLVANFRAQNYRLTEILKMIKIPRRTYYHWLNHRTSKRRRLDEVIKPHLKRIWVNNYKVYGVLRLQIALRAMGFRLGTRRIKRLMNELSIHSLMASRFKKPGTHVDYEQRPNLIKNLLRPHSIWRADITYLELKPGQWVYLSSVFDEESHQVIAHKVVHHMTSDLVTDTLSMALRSYAKPEFMHTDMGSQYTSQQFESALIMRQIKHSYSLRGHPYDNSPIEAFHSLLKREFVFLTKFSSFDDLVLRTENYIHWYNNDRIRISV